MPGLVSLAAAGLCRRDQRASAPRRERSGLQPQTAISQQNCKYKVELLIGSLQPIFCLLRGQGSP